MGQLANDLLTFRDLDFSRVVLSRPMIGPFATRYFSHLFDPSRFATSVIFAVSRQLTVNYSDARLLVENPFVEHDYSSNTTAGRQKTVKSDTWSILFLTEVRHLVEKKSTKCQTLLFSKQVSSFFYLASAITKIRLAYSIDR